jgi:hypothetical protein
VTAVKSRRAQDFADSECPSPAPSEPAAPRRAS